MSSKDQSIVSEILTETRTREDNCDWDSAIVFYEKALRTIAQNDKVKSQAILLHELLAKAYSHRAFQSNTRDEFKYWMRLARGSYERTTRLYKTMNETGLSIRSRARMIVTE